VPYINEEDKLTLRAIERRYRLSTDAVAAIASVEPRLVYLMEQGGALEKKDAQRILRRLSEVTGQAYSIENVGGYWIKGQ
jgi:hypothetical protein